MKRNQQQKTVFSNFVVLFHNNMLRQNEMKIQYTTLCE